MVDSCPTIHLSEVSASIRPPLGVNPARSSGSARKNAEQTGEKILSRWKKKSRSQTLARLQKIDTEAD